MLVAATDWVCSNGCVIETASVNDNRCDCADCGDERDWNCDSCSQGCPTVCGRSTRCNLCKTTEGHYCSFPFTYQSVSWKSCTALDNDGTDWCFDDRGGDNYGNCDPATCTGACKTTEGYLCRFPFTYQGVLHESCATVDWCYDNRGDYNWGFCDPATCAGGWIPNITRQCSDGCLLKPTFVNDSSCDCSDCGDEPDWDCNSCSQGCPTECGTYTECKLTSKPSAPSAPPELVGGATGIRDCPAGAFCLGGRLQPCPPGSWSNEGESSPSCKPCLPGRFGQNVNTSNTSNTDSKLSPQQAAPAPRSLPAVPAASAGPAPPHVKSAVQGSSLKNVAHKAAPAAPQADSKPVLAH
eukprot:g60221.t1